MQRTRLVAYLSARTVSGWMARWLDTAQASARTTVSTMCGTRSCAWSGTSSSVPLFKRASTVNAWRELGCAATIRSTCSVKASTMSAMMSAVVELALALAIFPGFMRSLSGWSQAVLFRVYAGLSVDGLSAVVDQLDILGYLLRFLFIIFAEVKTRLLPLARVKDAARTRQLTPAKVTQAGFAWRLSKKAFSLPKVHAGSVHVREAEQLNKIVSQPPSLLPSMSKPSVLPYAAPDLTWVMGHQRKAQFRAGRSPVKQGDFCAGDTAFIHEAPAGGHPPATRPRAKFHTFKWSLLPDRFRLLSSSLPSERSGHGRNCPSTSSTLP